MVSPSPSAGCLHASEQMTGNRIDRGVSRDAGCGLFSRAIGADRVLPNLFGITSGSVSIAVCCEFCNGYCCDGSSLSSAGFSCRGFFATRSRRTLTATTRMMRIMVTRAPTTTPINGDRTIPASWPVTEQSQVCISSGVFSLENQSCKSTRSRCTSWTLRYFVMIK